MCKKHLLSQVVVAHAFSTALLCEFEASYYTEKSSRKSKRKQKGKKLCTGLCRKMCFWVSF